MAVRLTPDSQTCVRTHNVNLAALAVKSPSDAVSNLIQLLQDPDTTDDLHVCLQESDDVLYLPSLWWHMTLNIGEVCVFVVCFPNERQCNNLLSE